MKLEVDVELWTITSLWNDNKLTTQASRFIMDKGKQDGFLWSNVYAPREWAQFCIFSYIGWTFRSRDLTPRFSVMPATKCKGDTLVPPIYSIEMDAATFKDFRHIGVPTCGCGDKSSSEDAVLVIIEHPHSQRLRTVLDTSSSCSVEC
ncbi:hypothetical protein K1719_046744 [Acacia pycnantha]|nr:hypothetical protein K1719_046744 [Acacia pycnantha]